MDLRQLRYFVAAAEEAHMSRAASRLGLSQPALSQQIKELEEELGPRLFERLPRGLKLTSAGLDLLEQARRILADVEHTRERLRYAANGEVGRLRIAINEIAGQQKRVAKTFRTFRDLYPNVSLDLSQLTTFEQLDALRDGRIDAGFQHNQQQDQGFLDRVTLREDEFMLGLQPSHPLAQKDTLKLADIANEPLVWLHRSVNPLMSDQLMARLQSKGITPRIAIEAMSDISMMNFISVGLGIGLVVSAERWGDSGNVAFRHITDLSIPVNFIFAWRKQDQSPLLQNFARIVRDAQAAEVSTAPPVEPFL